MGAVPLVWGLQRPRRRNKLKRRRHRRVAKHFGKENEVIQFAHLNVLLKRSKIGVLCCSRLSI